MIPINPYPRCPECGKYIDCTVLTMLQIVKQENVCDGCEFDDNQNCPYELHEDTNFVSCTCNIYALLVEYKDKVEELELMCVALEITSREC